MKMIDGPRVPAKSGTARQLAVFCHGYGADGQDLIGLADVLAPLFPDMAFASPNAPDRVPGSPYGYQWFGLQDYDPDLLRRDPVHAAGIYAKMRQVAEPAAPLLDAFLTAELARHGLTDDRLVLIGFSQGTMMALHVGLRRPALAAIVGFSGALLGGSELAGEIRCRPPILLVHGAADPVVPVQALQGALNILGEAGLTAEFHVVPGLQHGIDNSGLQRTVTFLRGVLAQAVIAP